MSTRYRILVSVALLFVCTLPSAVFPQGYGVRVSGRRGGEVTFEPQGPGVLFGPLDPAVKRWYVPQELFSEYRWKQWEYTNYAKKLYERYVYTALEGDYFYDLYGNFLTRGWLIYDWRQEQPQKFGSDVFQDRRFPGWFNRLVIVSDSKGERHYALTIGDQIRTMLTPMTFLKPTFNGVQMDLETDRYAATLLLSRISYPGSGATPGNVPAERTNVTNLIGGRAVFQLGDFVRVGGTFVNTHLNQTLASFGSNPFTGRLTTYQNAQNLSWIEIVLSDDSPEDREGGAALFDQRMIITTLNGDRIDTDQMGYRPVIEGGFERVGFLGADGEEKIRIRYDFTDPSYNGPDKAEIREISFRLVVANDYRIEVTSNRQTNRAGKPVFLTVVQAPGNVKDNSNQTVIAIDYGLPTANQIYGFTLEVNDLQGFDFYGELDINHRFRQYPNIALDEHHTSSDRANAWMMNLSKLSYPWFLFLEAFSMDLEYTTHAYGVDGRGVPDYENEIFGRYELVDDNDDRDRLVDWNRFSDETYDNAVFPGWDENGNFVSDFNENDNMDKPNVVPDYEEPFLRYGVDRPEFLFGIDLNNNGWIDRFENDEVPDYPYKRDHRGYNLYVGAHLTPDLKLTLGQTRLRLISSEVRDLTNYLLLTFQKDYPAVGRVRVFERVKKVRDAIPDNLFQWIQPPGTRGTQQRIQDPMLAWNTWVNTLFLGFDHAQTRNLNVASTFKWEFYKQRDPAEMLQLRDIGSHERFLGLINKVDYLMRLGPVEIQPKWKSEFRRQTRDLLSDDDRKELMEMFFLIVRAPIFAHTSIQIGVEQTFFNDMLDDANDFSQTVLGFQFTNTTRYQGYSIMAQGGFSTDRRLFEDEELSTSGMRIFFTVYAGVR